MFNLIIFHYVHRDAFEYKIFFFKACEIIKLEVRDKSLKRLNRLLK